MPHEKIIFRNDMPMFGWIFTSIWIAMLAVPTWRFIRDSGFDQLSFATELAIIALFWLAGLTGCAYAFAKPRVWLAIAGDNVELRERWIWRNRVECFPLAQLSVPALVEEGGDSESSPYFRCTVITPTGRTISVSEHYNKHKAESSRDRLIAAMS